MLPDLPGLGRTRKKKVFPCHPTLAFLASRSAIETWSRVLVSVASDDDCGIATYSQVGTQFGYMLLWTMVLSYPLIAVIQEVCGRSGRMTGCGLADQLLIPPPGGMQVLLSF
jgi:Natural resistance-associated macrophage protein